MGEEHLSLRLADQQGTGTTRKIRVGVFGHYYPAYRDAVFTRLSRHPNFEFTFFAGVPPAGSFIRASKSKPYAYRPIGVWTISIPGTRNVFTYHGGLVSAVLRRRHDLVIVTNDILAPDVWLCCLLSRIVGVPVCIWGQGLSRPPGTLRDALRYALTRLAAASVYYSESGKQYWVRRGVPAEKLFVAYNALDTEKQIRIRSAIAVDGIGGFLAARGLVGRKVVAFLGRLVPGKKPWVFVDAVAWAAARDADIVGVVIGEGPQRQELEQRVREKGMERTIRFVGECYDEETLGRYLAASVAVVVPSDAGLVIQHAAVYGAPVILGDARGRHGPEQEIIEEGKTGLWCANEDVAAFGSAILKLVQDPEQRRTISTNLMRVIDEKYNVARMAQGFVDALHYCTRR